MPNDSRTLFQSFVKKGLSDRDALFAILDHHAKLHCFDRDHYAELTGQLLKDNAELKARVTALESR